MSSNLPPLDKVDEDLNLGFSESIDVTPKKCKHDLYLQSSTEVRCKKCGAGWQGPRVSELLK